MTPAELLREIKAMLQQVPDAARLGTVTSVTGGLFVMFDGEVSASTRSYKRLLSYSSPAVNDRVLLVRVGATWVVVGELA